MMENKKLYYIVMGIILCIMVILIAAGTFNWFYGKTDVKDYDSPVSYITSLGSIRLTP